MNRNNELKRLILNRASTLLGRVPAQSTHAASIILEQNKAWKHYTNSPIFKLH
jgi:hypothetical protein